MNANMNLQDWQERLLCYLRGSVPSFELLPDVDDLLVFLINFDPLLNPFDALCRDACNNSNEQIKEESRGRPRETEVTKRILFCLDELLFYDDHDLLRIFGRAAFADSSRKTLKLRYQRLRRVFHPDLGLADEVWLTEKMVSVNRAYDLAQSNFENPDSVTGYGVNFKNRAGPSGDSKSGSRRRKQRRGSSPSSSERSPSGEFQQDWLSEKVSGRVRGMRRGSLSALYSIDDFVHRNGIAVGVKYVGLLVFLALLGSAVFNFISEDQAVYQGLHGDQGYLPDQPLSNHGARNSAAKHSIAADEAVTLTDINIMIVEDSTKGAQSVQGLSMNEDDVAQFKLYEQGPVSAAAWPDKPDDYLKETEIQLPGPGPEQLGANVNRVPIKPLVKEEIGLNEPRAKSIEGVKEIAKAKTRTALDILSDFLGSLSLAYTSSNGIRFAEYFLKDGEYFSNVGWAEISLARHKLNAFADDFGFQIFISESQSANSWYSIIGNLRLSYTLKQHDQRVDKCIPIYVTLYETDDGFKVSSLANRAGSQVEPFANSHGC